MDVIVVAIIGGLVGLLLLWVVVRSAIVSALRIHQEWLENRSAGQDSMFD